MPCNCGKSKQTPYVAKTMNAPVIQKIQQEQQPQVLQAQQAIAMTIEKETIPLKQGEFVISSGDIKSLGSQINNPVNNTKDGVFSYAFNRSGAEGKIRTGVDLVAGAVYSVKLFGHSLDVGSKIQLIGYNKKDIPKTWSTMEWIVTVKENVNELTFSVTPGKLFSRSHNLYGLSINVIEFPPLPHIDIVGNENGPVEMESSTITNDFSEIYKTKINCIVNLLVQTQSNEYFSGTGFFISEDGYIATAGHMLVGGSSTPEPFVKRVYVQVYPENVVVEGKIIGVDRLYDVGLLRISASNRNYLQWKNSRDVMIGSPAVTIGNPLGDLVQSITCGVVSDNKLQDYSWMPESVSVDFNIVGGNSGGPVIDNSGKVIGIISWGYNVDSGFSLNGAISSYVCEKVINKLKQQYNGSPTTYPTGYIGINFAPVGMYDAIANNLSMVQGVVVKSVQASAKIADIRVGDVILEVNETKVGKSNNQETFGPLVHFAQIGSQLTLKIKRGSQMITKQVNVIALPPIQDVIFSNRTTIQQLTKKEIEVHV